MATVTRTTPLDEMVRVVNEGDMAIRLSVNSRTYEVPAKGEKLVMAEAAVIAFGDWEARGDSRAAEVIRIKGLYGALPGMKRDILDGNTVREVTDLELWDRNRPRVKVLLLDDTEVATVLADPAGETLGSPSVDLSRDELLQELIARQDRDRRLIDELLARQGPNDVETDSPHNAPKMQRTKPKVTAPRPDELT